jgi:uncharacterized repeat protein (TIGR01451 family)
MANGEYGTGGGKYNVSDSSNLTINDVTLSEGNSGLTSFIFSVTLSAPAGPGGVTFDIATADGTAQDDNPSGEDNDYIMMSLTAQTIPAGSSTYSFTVHVNGDQTFEPNESFFVDVNNVVGATVTDSQGMGTVNNDDAPPSADLSVSIQDTPDPVMVGGYISYTLSVFNSGPNQAASVTIADVLPNGTTFQSIISPEDWSCTTPSVGAGGLVSCATPSLNPGSAVFTFNVKVSASLPGGTVITNTATTGSSSLDPDPGNDSGTASTTVIPANTTTTITSDTPDPSLSGQAVTVSYTVSADPSDAGIPTGTVTVTDGFNVCTATVAAGACTLNLTTLGVHTLSATYGGDSYFDGSVSANESHQVNQAGTSLELVASLNPAASGTVVTLTATIAVIAPGAGTPTGSVSFYDSSSLVGTVTLDANGVATLILPSTSNGQHTFTAIYTGDANFATSQQISQMLIPWRIYLPLASNHAAE